MNTKLNDALESVLELEKTNLAKLEDENRSINSRIFYTRDRIEKLEEMLETLKETYPTTCDEPLFTPLS